VSLTLLLKSFFPTRESGVPIHRAVRHVAHCIGEVEGSAAHGDRFPRARDAIRQAAMNGSLKIRGRKQMLDRWSSTLFSEVASRIPREYWKTHELTTLTASDGNGARASVHTALKPPLFRTAGIGYSDLEVDWDEVSRLWSASAPDAEGSTDGTA
jgi:hypothetical protein